MEHHSAVLLRRLSPYCARALEGAASLCQTRIVGQNPALNAVVQRLRASKTGMTPKNWPQGIFLLDEVEKAHRDVMNQFYQVFDRGFMRDGEGHEIDFRNTVILMTSNLGCDLLMQLLDEQPEATESELHELLRPILRDHFQPALLARFQTVIYRMAAKQKQSSLQLTWDDEQGIVMAFDEQAQGEAS